jgi:hypothetical protein
VFLDSALIPWIQTVFFSAISPLLRLGHPFETAFPQSSLQTLGENKILSEATLAEWTMQVYRPFGP